MPTEISTSQFDFTSAREWQKLPSDDPSRVILFCPEANTRATLTMDAMAIPADKLQEVATKVIVVRKENHRKAVAATAAEGENPTVVFGDERVVTHADGQIWEVSYLGTQAGKNVFAFVGYVTRNKIVHLYVESKLPLAEGQAEILQEVIKGFKIELP